MKKQLIVSILLAFFASFAIQAQTPRREAVKPGTEKQQRIAAASPKTITKAKHKSVKKHKLAKKHRHGKKPKGLRAKKRNLTNARQHPPQGRRATGSATEARALPRATRATPAQPAAKPTRMQPARRIPRATPATPAQPAQKTARIRPGQSATRSQKQSRVSGNTDQKAAKMTQPQQHKREKIPSVRH